ncbi:exodeoxyribonuclease VII large subunit [Rhodoplanes sp. TEM]|uniref:Exodeoxyribonuclease 7 large subunit n=1 Tax=Rhodoplanes tepidamans TaxID=200616 RepID=A0ABT5J666_RHOTP|nr:MULTISPECIES: exodeoxyribonuclease VII large subunit [Rhodoplanes]MDC7784535.1 exodeoxyribonuclease VII large subunit [Rhodoplanes tepidamans]MDC7984442.1 exodeoxyribonuclease VII large subunit [Rhodoplanes sp. TEM]MDQ0355763.1 exodeoxyribonuclease VII large subunit [Rhodoplanes tepidamans]
MDQPRLNIPEWTVSELSSALKRTVEDAFGHVRVRGEISGFRGVHSSGHAYFCLKDESARIDAVVWRTAFARMRIKPEEGLEVIATGRLTTYPGRSTYQIVIESLEPAGLGALMALLEQRKQALAAEGLFDEARKQLLPSLPGVIGVVTSPTGAVIRDILHRLEDRFPRPVLVWPVRVQGEGAAEEIAAAIRGFNALPEDGPIPRPDLLIVARGGGSIEDLWAFNEEIVVRAAADSFIPLISAVGHETDVTLIDFASDRRAPTPTAAAEMAVPVRSELMAKVDGLGRRVLTCWVRAQEGRRVALRSAARALPTADALLGGARQRLDAAAGRLPRALLAGAHRHRSDFSRAAARLTPGLLRNRVSRERERVKGLSDRTARCLKVHAERRRDRFAAVSGRLGAALRASLAAQRQALVRDRERITALARRAERASRGLLAERRARLSRAEKLLQALSYTGVLARGFALVRGADDRPLRSAAVVIPGQRLSLEFADGRVAATADRGAAGDLPPPAPASTAAERPQVPKPVTRRKAPAEGQGSLF